MTLDGLPGAPPGEYVVRQHHAVFGLNAVAEAFFATLEHELLADAAFATGAEAHRAVAEFIEVWRHSTLGYVSPARYERELAEGRRAA